MEKKDIYGELVALEQTFGELQRSLHIGDQTILICGLDAALADDLAHRWGPFLSERAQTRPFFTIKVHRGDKNGWLTRDLAGERYRMEAINPIDRRVIVSYNFAILVSQQPDDWRVAINDQGEEPAGRILENVLRYLTARMAIAQGGLAMHAAGVLKNGKAYMFAGISRSGKSTVSALSTDTVSLGDDMGMVIRSASGWHVPALPFDNSEAVPQDALLGSYPLAGIWRLHQAGDHRIETPQANLGIAALTACAAFPWAYPELADELLEQVVHLVEDGMFANLHFRKDAGFWSLLN
jgi:hypothetical protein